MRNIEIIWLICLLCGACSSHADKAQLQKVTAERDSLLRIVSKEKALGDSIREAGLRELERLRKKPWKVDTFNNEYGEATKDKFIGYDVQGTFGNSATLNEILYVRILVTKSSAGIFLHEYNQGKPPQKFMARIKMKNSDGKEIEVKSTREWNQDGGLALSNNDYSQIPEMQYYSRFKNFIKNSKGDIKVIIYNEYSSLYRFVIDTTGFTDELALL